MKHPNTLNNSNTLNQSQTTLNTRVNSNTAAKQDTPKNEAGGADPQGSRQPANNEGRERITLSPSTKPYNYLSAYSPKRKVQILFAPVGRTKQQFKDECDINNIMARYQQTGLIEFVQKHQPRYQDCTGADYQSAMQTIANANSMFQAMPSELRSEFNNSPAEFVDFCSNPENRPRLKEMGLLAPETTIGPLPTIPAAATQPNPVSVNPQASTTTETKT